MDGAKTSCRDGARPRPMSPGYGRAGRSGTALLRLNQTLPRGPRVTPKGEAAIGGTIAGAQSGWQGGGPSPFAMAATEVATAIAAASVGEDTDSPEHGDSYLVVWSVRARGSRSRRDSCRPGRDAGR